MSRFWDDSIFLRPGEETPQPLTLFQLLCRLDVHDADEATQVAAVRGLPAENEPNVNLRTECSRSVRR